MTYTLGKSKAFALPLLRASGEAGGARATLDAGECRLAWSLARRVPTLFTRILLALA